MIGQSIEATSEKATNPLIALYLWAPIESLDSNYSVIDPYERQNSWKYRLIHRAHSHPVVNQKRISLWNSNYKSKSRNDHQVGSDIATLLYLNGLSTSFHLQAIQRISNEYAKFTVKFTKNK